MFKREERHGKFVGYKYETDRWLFFFGSRFLPKHALQTYFPSFEFCFLKQVHGRTVVEAQPDAIVEADAHFTERRNLALVSQTADCVPILLASPSRVCAIHSGWRGVAQNIIGATASVFASDPVQVAAIGPHISRQSFEIGKDVASQLLQSAPWMPNSQRLLHTHDDPNKVFFDLTEMVRQQIQTSLGTHVRIEECLEDTRTSVQFHSYRRDKSKAERQYSFVVLKA